MRTIKTVFCFIKIRGEVKNREMILGFFRTKYTKMLGLS